MQVQQLWITWYYNLAYMHILDGTASKITQIKSSEAPAAIEEGKYLEHSLSSSLPGPQTSIF